MYLPITVTADTQIIPELLHSMFAHLGFIRPFALLNYADSGYFRLLIIAGSVFPLYCILVNF